MNEGGTHIDVHRDRRRAPLAVRRRSVAGRVAVVLTAASIVAGGCSLPSDERVSPFNADEIPDALANPTTTTTVPPTTTTTTPPAPQSTIAGQPTTTSTTTAPFETTPVRVFYTIGLSDELQPVRREQPADVSITALVNLLESPTGITEFNLRSSVRFGLIDDVVVERGVATVELDEAVLDRMPNNERERAIAQIVLSFTSFVTVDAGAIGAVLFEVDGEGYEVFVPELGGSSNPGEPLVYSDFASLVVSTSAPASSTTTTTTGTPTSEVAQ